MECYHCATIHPELTEVLPEFADGYAAQYFVGHGAEFGEDVQGFTVDGSEGLDRIPGVAEDQDRRYYAITIKPQVFINLVPDHVIFHRMFPLAADRTIVECDWLYLPHVVEERQGRQPVGRAVRPGQPAGLRGLRADASRRCRSRLYADGGVLVPSEHHIGAFHDWVKRCVSVTAQAVRRARSAQVARAGWLICLGARDQRRRELVHPVAGEPVGGARRR